MVFFCNLFAFGLVLMIKFNVGLPDIRFCTELSGTVAIYPVKNLIPDMYVSGIFNYLGIFLNSCIL